MKAKICSKKKTCASLLRELQDANNKGIVVWDFFNIETCTLTRSIIGYKSAASAKGTAFNFCPYCGGDFREKLKLGAPDAK